MPKPKYSEGDEKSYLPTVIAILIVIAVAISTFVISILPATERNLDSDLGIESVSPTNESFPSGPPEIAPPDSPPE